MDTTKIAILIILGIIALWLVSKATKIFSKNSPPTTPTTPATTSSGQPWDWSWLKFVVGSVAAAVAILGGIAIMTFVVHWCWCYMATDSSITIIQKVELVEIHVAPHVWSRYEVPDKEVTFDIPYPIIIRPDGDDRRTFVGYPNKPFHVSGVTKTLEFMGTVENQYSFLVRETDHQ